jgi:hypothetical protein
VRRLPEPFRGIIAARCADKVTNRLIFGATAVQQAVWMLKVARDCQSYFDHGRAARDYLVLDWPRSREVIRTPTSAVAALSLLVLLRDNNPLAD